MSSGTLWTNMPSSADITEITLYNMIVDQAPDQGTLNDDLIWISITDESGNWWKLLILFVKEPDSVSSITARSETTSNTSTYTGRTTPFTFDSSTSIDLLSTSNYDKPDACYQNANIGSINALVSYLGDDVSFKKTALISYRLRIN